MTPIKKKTVTIPWAACTALAVTFILTPGSHAFPDCNNNGIDDSIETATTFTEISIAVESYPSQLEDLDGDGDLDLLGTSPLSWRENLDGAGSFGPTQLIDNASGDVTTGDVDGDGDPDLVLRVPRESDCVTIPATIQIYENLGAGSFGSAQVILQLFYCSGWCPTFAGDLVVADSDTDGDLDVLTGVVHCTTGRVYTLWNEGMGDSWDVDPATGYASDLDVVDVNGDGINDVVSVDDQSIAWHGGGEFYFAWCLGSPYALHVADTDGDGDPDLFVDQGGGGDSNRISLFENTTGLGHYFEMQAVASTGGSAYDHPRFTDGDLNGDGSPDLLWANSRAPNSPVQWHANSDGAFGPQESIGESFGTYATTIDTGDIDGDGDVDVLVPYTGGICNCCDEGTGPGCDCAPCEEIVCSIDPFCCDVTWTSGCALYADDWCGCCFNQDPGQCAEDRIVWLQNEGDDCNGNRIPDECESDCNANGLADTCDLRSGGSVDCDGSGTPDECEINCPFGDCDTDGDGCQDETDSHPGDQNLCGDTDSDGCDDCSSGTFDPTDDGANSDSDGVCDLTDCNMADNEVWSEPDPATGLQLVSQGAATELTWDRPQEAGGIAPRYDVLRSTDASDFLSGETVCVESDAGDRNASDSQDPEPGEVYHYAVRVENGCPGGSGAMGTDSNGVPRLGMPCVAQVPGDGLVLNEVDYDQMGVDEREFVEVFNAGDAAVDLTDMVLILANPVAEYARVSLSAAGVLPAGGYLVVASPLVDVDPGASVILFPSNTNNIQNTDQRGVALFDLGSNELVDALSYKGSVTATAFDGILGTWNLVEGSPTLWTDTGYVEAAMVRYANGRDTDDAAADWRTTGPPSGLLTPGSANTTAW